MALSKGEATQNWLRTVLLANESDGDELSDSHALLGMLWQYAQHNYTTDFKDLDKSIL